MLMAIEKPDRYIPKPPPPYREHGNDLPRRDSDIGKTIPRDAPHIQPREQLPSEPPPKRSK